MAEPQYRIIKARAEVFDLLRRDAAENGFAEASITYGWTAMRLMNEALEMQIAEGLSPISASLMRRA